MARPTVTAAAMQRARELAAQLALGRPVVAVSWEPPAHNNVRGSEGETIWVHTSGKWTVSVGDLQMNEDAEVETTRIGGLEFLFCGLPEDDPRLDEVTIDYADGEFVVRPRAI
jgi:hypothetical protein